MEKKNEKRLIFTDAGLKDGKYQIAMYDKSIGKTETILLEGVSNNNEAEYYSILNALIYCVSNKLERVVILNDNESSCNNKSLVNFSSNNNIRIHWIPRELNTIADKTTKYTPSKKEEEFIKLKIYKSLLENQK